MVKLVAVLFVLLSVYCNNGQQAKPSAETASADEASTKNTKNIACIFFAVSPSTNSHIPKWSLSVVRTTTGAFVEYEYQERMEDSDSKNQTAELNLREWQDFINALYACSVDIWGKYNYTERTTYVGNESWDLDIIFSDKERLKYHGKYDPPHADGFMRIMNDMKTRAGMETATHIKKNIADEVKSLE